MGEEYTFNPFTGKLDATLNPDESITHSQLSDMPDAAGTNTDHDERYLQKAATTYLRSFNINVENVYTMPVGSASAHGTIQVNNKFYVGFRYNYPNIVVFNSPDTDLTDQTVLTIPGGYYGCESMCYDSANNKIYFNLVGNGTYFRIGTLDLSNNQITVSNSFGNWGGSPAITTDGTNIYAVTYNAPPSVFKKIRISDMTVIASANWTGVGWGHAIKYHEATGYVYATSSGGPSYFAKINPADLSFTQIALTFGTATDDFIILDFDDSEEMMDWAYYAIVGSEVTNSAVRIDLNDLSVSYFFSPITYGFFNDSTYVYGLGINGYISRWTLSSFYGGAVIIGQYYKTTYLPNELFYSAGGKLFFTAWYTSPVELVEFSFPPTVSVTQAINDNYVSSGYFSALSFISNPTGTIQPYATTSTRLNTNLNAEYLNSHADTYFATADHNHTGVYQLLDADLTAIGALTETSGMLKKTAADTWALGTESDYKNSLITDLNLGDGSDGDVTITEDTTITRPMFYNSLTINEGVTLNPNGFRIFCKGTIDNNGTIAFPPANGGNASGTTGGGATSAAPTGIECGTRNQGGNGRAGATTRGANPVNPPTTGFYMGGLMAQGGIGGTGGSGVPYDPTPVPAGAINNQVYMKVLQNYLWINGVALRGGAGGIGGVTGSGDGVANGGGSGGGGAGAIPVIIFAKTITGSGTIASIGGNGGDGGIPVSGNCGGGGGGGAGGGGFIYLVYETFTFTGTLDVSGGTGGIGASGVGTGTSGANGQNGNEGIVVKFNVKTGVIA